MPIVHRPSILRAAPVLVAAALCGCCSVGDPSCAVWRELDDEGCFQTAAYCPDLSLEGLRCADWYCDPIGWTPECSKTFAYDPPDAPRAPTRTAVFAVPVNRRLVPERVSNP